jgi:phenylacetate-CoA ligase
MKSTLKDRFHFLKDSLYLSSKGTLVYHIKFGREFRSVLERLEKTQWYSEVELKSYQDEKLRSLIHQAYEHVPYYRRVLRELHLRPSDIRSAEDLKKLPILTKDTLKAHAGELVADNISRWFRSRLKARRSGVSGAGPEPA